MPENSRFAGNTPRPLTTLKSRTRCDEAVAELAMMVPGTSVLHLLKLLQQMMMRGYIFLNR